MRLILRPHRRDGLVLAVACGLIGLPYGVLADAIGERMTLVIMGLVVVAFTVYFWIQLVREGAIRGARGRRS